MKKNLGKSQEMTGHKAICYNGMVILAEDRIVINGSNEKSPRFAEFLRAMNDKEIEIHWLIRANAKIKSMKEGDFIRVEPIAKIKMELIREHIPSPDLLPMNITHYLKHEKGSYEEIVTKISKEENQDLLLPIQSINDEINVTR